MARIEEIDTNLAVKTEIKKENIVFLNANNRAFSLYGVFYENGMYRRMPEGVAKSVSEGVHFLHANTAGGRIRFKTDSPYIAINVKYGYITRLPHFSLTGTASFDIYVDEKYHGTFVPPKNIIDSYEGLLELGDRREREITLNFPLYSEVKELYIGLDGASFIQPPKKYTQEKPFVFYGSSITQGGCASRPGMAYPSLVCRRLNANHINLGFSGSARAEDEISEYISKLDMSIFVYDYDHNAPSFEHLAATHEKMFKKIREQNPDLPIVFMSVTSMPRFRDNPEKRKEIIFATYQNAKATGDNNVYFIDGEEIRTAYDNEGAVEGVHPSDLGFYFIANAVQKVLENIIKKQ